MMSYKLKEWKFNLDHKLKFSDGLKITIGTQFILEIAVKEKNRKSTCPNDFKFKSKIDTNSISTYHLNDIKWVNIFETSKIFNEFSKVSKFLLVSCTDKISDC